MNLNPAEYKTERQKRGSQKGVALALGVDYRTIQRREAGDIQITREASMALMALPVRSPKCVRRQSNVRDDRQLPGHTAQPRNQTPTG
jgi:hypothetical protein